MENIEENEICSRVSPEVENSGVPFRFADYFVTAGLDTSGPSISAEEIISGKENGASIPPFNKTKVIDRFPLENHSEFPLPNEVGMFCQPDGCIITSKFRPPEYTMFALTTCEGQRYYCGCYNFMEPSDSLTGHLIPIPRRRGSEGEGEQEEEKCGSNASLDSTASSSSSGSTSGVAGGAFKTALGLFNMKTKDLSGKKKVKKGASQGDEPIEERYVYSSTKVEACESHPARLYTLKSLLLVSRLPLFNRFFRVLEGMHRRIEQTNGSDRDDGKQMYAPHRVEHYIVHVLMDIKLPLPSSGRGVTFDVGPNLNIPLTFPPSLCFSLTDFSIHPLFQNVSVDTVIELVKIILLDGKLILCSSNYNTLTLAVFSLISLIYPMNYAYTFIPLLPNSLKDIAMAPTPFLVGVHSSFFKDEDLCLPDDLIICNLDDGKLTPDKPPFPEMPQEQYKKLRSGLTSALGGSHYRPTGKMVKEAFSLVMDYFKKEKETPKFLEEKSLEEQKDSVAVDLAIRLQFLHLFSSLFQPFREYSCVLKLYPKPAVVFKAGFLKVHPKSEFISQLIQTQSFEQFLGKYILPQGSIFDKLVDAYLEDDQDIINAVTQSSQTYVDSMIGEEKSSQLYDKIELKAFAEDSTDPVNFYGVFPHLRADIFQIEVQCRQASQFPVDLALNPRVASLQEISTPPGKRGGSGSSTPQRLNRRASIRALKLDQTSNSYERARQNRIRNLKYYLNIDDMMDDLGDSEEFLLNFTADIYMKPSIDRDAISKFRKLMKSDHLRFFWGHALLHTEKSLTKDKYKLLCEIMRTALDVVDEFEKGTVLSLTKLLHVSTVFYTVINGNKKYIYDGLSLSPVWQRATLWEHLFYDMVEMKRHVVHEGASIRALELVYLEADEEEKMNLEEEEDLLLVKIIEKLLNYQNLLQIPIDHMRNFVRKMSTQCRLSLNFKYTLELVLDQYESPSSLTFGSMSRLVTDSSQIQASSDQNAEEEQVTVHVQDGDSECDAESVGKEDSTNLSASVAALASTGSGWNAMSLSASGFALSRRKSSMTETQYLSSENLFSSTTWTQVFPVKRLKLGSLTDGEDILLKVDHERIQLLDSKNSKTIIKELSYADIHEFHYQASSCILTLVCLDDIKGSSAVFAFYTTECYDVFSHIKAIVADRQIHSSGLAGGEGSSVLSASDKGSASSIGDPATGNGGKPAMNRLQSQFLNPHQGVSGIASAKGGEYLAKIVLDGDEQDIVIQVGFDGINLMRHDDGCIIQTFEWKDISRYEYNPNRHILTIIHFDSDEEDGVAVYQFLAPNVDEIYGTICLVIAKVMEKRGNNKL
eukprot:Nk52_evm72s151 gene=Nk52_evmTU72s151